MKINDVLAASDGIKVTVITEPGKSPRVFRTRRDGADALVNGRPLLPDNRRRIGEFIEHRIDKVKWGIAIAEEVEVE